METSTILTILGISLTAILGIWGLYATLKNYKPGEITFIIEEFIPLFDSIVKNLSELQITYLNEPVKPNIYLLKGALLNTGKKDISPDMVENNIKIELPVNFKWLTAKVISKSNNVKAEANMIDDTELDFEFGLFRTGEFVRFQALYEMPIDEVSDAVDEEIFVKKRKGVKYYHRIKDVKDIKRKTMISEDKSKKDLRSALYMLIGGFILAIVFGSLFMTNTPQQDIVYESRVNNKKVTIEKIESEMVYFKGLNNDEEKDELSIRFFNEDFIPTNDLINKGELINALYFTIFFFIGTPLIYLSIEYSNYRKNMRFANILFRREQTEKQ